MPAVNEPITFKDDAEIADKNAKAVSAMQQSGIINGITDGAGFRFAPQQQATRAHAAAMIARFYEALNG